MLFIAILTTAASSVHADEGVSPLVQHQSVAARNVCAWPNLTTLGDGTIVATIFNQPAHGTLPGDVDCWASTDGGETWERRATVAQRPEPNSNRMNVAAGLAGNGDLVVVASGYRRVGEDATFEERLLPANVYRSSDGGATWSVPSALPTAPDGQHVIPFGDVAIGADGRPRVTAYTHMDVAAAWILASDDDGKTFADPVQIGIGVNECAPLHLGDGRWLAAIRTVAPADVRMFASDDDGATWTDQGPVTEASQHPAHLLQLADGRVVMTYGNRRPERPGIEAVLSSDEGVTWGEPIRLLELPRLDLGYPSSAERPDGAVVTAYYARQGPGCETYHMGVVIWTPPSP